uniref:Chemokine interleukin-8-like domain-containing protein n=1 Tax=Poecilia reticulata TaxID=8081 RepID=A0A3P9QDX3_POERE
RKPNQKLLLLLLCYKQKLYINSSGPKECCFKFFRNIVNKNLIFSYYMTDSRCFMLNLITKKGRHICVDPNQLWVKKIIDFLDRKPFLLQPT